MFAIQQSHYVEDRNQVLFAALFLSGKAKKAYNWFEKEQGLEDATWEDLKEFLEEQAKPASIRVITVHQQYHNLKQGTNQSVNSLVAAIDDLESQMLEYSEEQCMHYLLLQL